ncbi:MAG: pyridoxamine 5'-phosphate oxidase [Verrucomicrobia bacterium]|nr:pyridoxamine 5'-phosphate oxidase [Verrucomicrobiota bacterium]
MSKGIRDRLLVFLKAHRVLTVAVTDGEGRPHAAALFYAVDKELRFYVVTEPSSQHGMAMLARGEVAGTVQRDEQQWREIQGVQFHGACRQLDGAERVKGWTLYTARFPFIASGNLLLTSALTKTAIWRIEPEWIRLIDNRIAFGHKEEWRRHRRQ